MLVTWRRTHVLLVALVMLLAPRPAMAQFLDPDHCWTCRDSFEHAGVAAALDGTLRIGLGHRRIADASYERVAWVALAGAAFELGQWDAARGEGKLGQRGYGWGWKDETMDVAGALAAEGVAALFDRLVWRHLRRSAARRDKESSPAF
jgi:hypothetical protein